MEIHELYSSRISLCVNFLYIYSVNVYTTPPPDYLSRDYINYVYPPKKQGLWTDEHSPCSISPTATPWKPCAPCAA